MVEASASGAIDFTACDQSPKWWRGALLKCKALEDRLHREYHLAMAQRAFGVQGMHDLGQNAQERQEYALAALYRYRSVALPWNGAPEGQNKSSDPIDAITAWYQVFGHDPDLVKEMNGG